MHYLLLSDLNHDIGPRDIVGALVNQTDLSPDSLGNIELDSTFAEVEVFEDPGSYDSGDVDSVGPASVRSAQWEKKEWKELDNYIQQKKELVQLEREEEMERHEQEIRTTSGREREKLGRAILHLRGKDVGEDLGGKQMVKFSRNKKSEELPDNEISVGDLVTLSKNQPLRDDNPSGTVAERTNYSLTIAFDPPLDGFLLDKGLRMDLYVNDITYQRMLDSLEALPFHTNRDLVKKLVGLSPHGEVRGSDIVPLAEELDDSQTKAVQRSVNADPFFCIHGPPGTGKTTTLASTVEELARQEEKILATAGSNIAVDNMVEFLVDRDVEVVRVGHPARITPYLRKISLDYQVQEHPKYEKTRELRDRAQELQDEQDSYQFPSGRYRRGMSDTQIHQLAQKGSGSRGVSREKIKEMSTWLSLQKEIDGLYERSKELEEAAISEIIEKADVICTTNSTAGSSLLEGKNFDVVVIDEATQATEPSCLIPLNKGERAILAGDHKQLPPTILSEEAKDDLQVTAFEKLLKRAGSSITEMLVTQYRMNTEIMEFSNNAFYDGNLKADESVSDHTLGDIIANGSSLKDLQPDWLQRALDPSRPVIFLDTSDLDARERQRPGSNSRENPGEAEIVSQVVKELLDHLPPKEIGIISPYDDQIGLLNSRHDQENLEIKTVDGFQGREKEVIVISFVRSNDGQELGFLTDERRLNVSLTRARRKLVMVGDAETLSNHTRYAELLQYVKNNDFYNKIAR
ncbi:IGHMBP2 family helicase [Candidatus Bipolaricaulota bacterium]|nr:IGHMBP2 family helicase [Candidatus Bipolaricaulota bacterium]